MIAAGDRARAETYVEQEMNSHTGYLDKFAEQLEAIQHGMDSLKKKTAALQESIFGLQASTSGLESDVDDARGGVADMFTAVSDNVGNLMSDVDEVIKLQRPLLPSKGLPAGSMMNDLRHRESERGQLDLRSLSATPSGFLRLHRVDRYPSRYIYR